MLVQRHSCLALATSVVDGRMRRNKNICLSRYALTPTFVNHVVLNILTICMTHGAKDRSTLLYSIFFLYVYCEVANTTFLVW